MFSMRLGSVLDQVELQDRVELQDQVELQDRVELQDWVGKRCALQVERVPRLASSRHGKRVRRLKHVQNAGPSVHILPVVAPCADG